jgi:trk system potassium uptake protein
MADKQHIVIAGIGEIGESLAGAFAKAGHEVMLIDRSEQRLSDLQERVDANVCLGHAADREVLRRAGVAEASIFLATTSQDASNLVATTKARELGARQTMALVKEVEFFEDRSGVYRGWLGLDLVLNSKFLLAQELHKLIRVAGASAVEDFAGNQIEMLQFKVERATAATGKPLSAVPLPRESLLVGIRRGGSLIIPRGDDVVQVGDELLAIGRTDLVPQVAKLLGCPAPKGQKIILLGGGTVGFVLARGLQEIAYELILIERDRERCEFLARELERTTVVHGDGTEVELLGEEGISACDVFAAVSGDDERNIIAGRLAKALGARRAIAHVSRSGYSDVCRHLGLEVVLSPQQIVTREVMREMMPQATLGVTPVMGGDAEFLEIVASPHSRVAGRALKDAGFPRGSVVCALLEGAQFTFPRGESVIAPGMRAIVFCRLDAREAVERLLGE